MTEDEHIEEVMNRVHKLELKARRLVRESFAGEYQSSFRGQGLDFDDFRSVARIATFVSRERRDARQQTAA